MVDCLGKVSENTFLGSVQTISGKQVTWCTHHSSKMDETTGASILGPALELT